MVDTYGVSSEILAFFFILLYMFFMITQIPAGKIIDKYGNRTALSISISCYIIGTFIGIGVFFIWTLGFTLVLIPGTILGMFFYSIYYTIIIPVEAIYLTNLTEKRKTESLGVVNLITASAKIPSGVIGSSLADFVYPITPDIVNLGGFIFLLWNLKKFFGNGKSDKLEKFL